MSLLGHFRLRECSSSRKAVQRVESVKILVRFRTLPVTKCSAPGRLRLDHFLAMKKRGQAHLSYLEVSQVWGQTIRVWSLTRKRASHRIHHFFMSTANYFAG